MLFYIYKVGDKKTKILRHRPTKPRMFILWPFTGNVFLNLAVYEYTIIYFSFTFLMGIWVVCSVLTPEKCCCEYSYTCFLLKLYICFSKKFIQEWKYTCCSVSQSWETLQPHGLQHTRPPCPSPSPKVCPSSCPLHRWCHPVISSSDTFFSSALNLSQHQGLFQWISCSHQMTKIREFRIQH